jgi:hypothetical protein
VTSRVSDRGEGPSEGMGGIHSNTSAVGEDNPSSAAPHIGEMDVQDDASVVFSEQPGSDAASRSDSFDHSQLDYGADDEDAAGFMGDRLFCHGVSDSAVDSHQLMVFQGSINGHQALILLDCGADTNFVSKSWVDKTKVNLRPLSSPTKVITATGGNCTASSQLMSADVRVVGKDVKSNLVVLPLATYDVILGKPWLQVARPSFDWAKWTCNGRSVSSTQGRSYGHPGRSARQLEAITVSPRYIEVMEKIKSKYASVFASTLPKRVMNKDAMVHSFIMKEGASPVKDGERRRSPEELRLAREMVREGEASGIIEESTSEWCSQLLMVMKKNQYGKITGKPRFCVDYRRVNALMRKDSHPLPLPESMFAQLHGAKVFSKLDLTKGFYQIGLAPECRSYLAFSTPDGPRQWTVMPFGIANAPATFQREMQRILKARLDTSVMVYIDDILIFSKDADDHAEQVEWVLEQLLANGYYANPDKCEFFQSEVNFLGHVIKEGGLAVQQHKVDSIVQWPVPTCVKDVRSFLGLTGYYRRFVEGYSGIAAPLYDLTQKDTPFLWGEKEQAAFVLLKQSLVKAPTLATPDSNRPYVLHTDASGYAVGATLSQVDAGGVLRPVAFMSKKMSSTQRNYPVHEWELLAVMEALQAWRCYLYGSPHSIEILSDHHSLQYVNTQPNLSARQSRWVEQLQDYIFKIRHVAGEKNGAADALSRRSDHELAHKLENEARIRAGLRGVFEADRPRLQLEVAGVEVNVSTRHRPSQEGVESYESDISASGSSASSSVVAPHLMDDIRRLAIVDPHYQDMVARYEHLGLLVQDGLVYSTTGLLYIPQDSELRTTLMREVHDAPTGGHLGREKTYSRLTQQVYWKGVYDDVRDYLMGCLSCQSIKASNRVAAGLLQPLPIPARRWETISMDFVGPLPKTSAGHDWLLVVVDKFSKMIHLIACTVKSSAAQIAQLVYDNVIRLHGFPESIISDRDTRFTSNFWRALWDLSGTKLRMSSSYHPQSDGQTEVVNRGVQDMLKAYVSDTRNDWDQHLTAMEIAVNSSRHASTGYTPHFLNHGQEMRLPFGIALKKAESTNVPAAGMSMKGMAAHDETARSRLIEAQQKQKSYADAHRRDEVYQINDQVLLRTDHIRGHPYKLEGRYFGPFAVIAAGPVNVTLALPADMKMHANVHVEKVKRYTPSVGQWVGRVQGDRPPPVLSEGEGEPEWEVEAIAGKSIRREEVKVGSRKVRKDVIRYLVYWKGYPVEDATWEPADNVKKAMDLVVDYERALDESGGHVSVVRLAARD